MTAVPAIVANLTLFVHEDATYSLLNNADALCETLTKCFSVASMDRQEYDGKKYA